MGKLKLCIVSCQSMLGNRGSKTHGGRIKGLVLPLLAAFVLTKSQVWARAPIRVLDGIVSRVSDGDTLQVTDHTGTKFNIRLYGIDAPETVKVNPKTGNVGKPGQPYAEEAFAALNNKLKGRWCRVEVMDVDRYRRAVSLVRLGDTDVNLEMLREGHAWAYRQYLYRPYTVQYIAAEEEARVGRLGLWRQESPQPPWEFRKILRLRGEATHELLPRHKPRPH